MRARTLALAAATAVLVAAVAALRLSIAPDGFADRDGYYFALGVERYSLREMRPFWPGYPVLIGLARLLRLFTGDALAALHALSATSSALATVPVAVIAARLAGDVGAPGVAAAVVAAGLWTISPLVWAVGSQAYGEPAALLLLLTAVAVSLSARERGGAALIGVLAGLGLGCRPPYLTLLPAVAAVHPAWRAPEGARRPLIVATVVALAVTCAAWLGWQASQESLDDQVAAARGRMLGHFQDYGHSLATDADLGARAGLAARSAIRHGLAAGRGGDALSLAWAAVLVVMVASGTRRLVTSADRSGVRLLIAVLVVYGALVFVLHDLRHARYALPLTAGLALLAALGVPRGRWSLAAAAALVLVAGASALPALRAQAARPVLGLAVADWLRAKPRAHVLVRADDRYLPFFLDRAGLRWTRSSPETLSAMVRGGTGDDFYATFPPAVRPEAWALAERWARGEQVEVHAPREILLLRPGPVSAP